MKDDNALVFEFGNELTEPVNAMLYEQVLPLLAEFMESKLQVMASSYAIAFALGMLLTFVEDQLT
jgi:hypothetical protein